MNWRTLNHCFIYVCSGAQVAPLPIYNKPSQLAHFFGNPNPDSLLASDSYPAKAGITDRMLEGDVREFFEYI